jgi:6-pyruvoyltetrahydropterin/6-carboxytetrahydropterin synthase
MAFQITVTREFAAGHQLRLYDGSLEPLHGHNWRVQVVLEAQALDGIGVVMDFHQVERLIDGVAEPMRDRFINDVPPFSAGLNPSAENVAWHFGQSLLPHLPPSRIRLLRVEVWETGENSAVYLP